MEETSKPILRRSRRRWLRPLLLIAGPLAMIAAGLWLYLHSGRVISTDNAFVQADKLTISPEVSGTVVSVAVRDNQRLAAGDVLFRLDDEPYRIVLTRARAHLEQVRNDLAARRATYQEKLAAIAEAREQADYFQRELDRQRLLAEGRVGTAAELDEAQHNLTAARRRLAVLERDAATVLAGLGGDADLPVEQQPDFIAARAEVAQAKRDLKHAVICAPQAGIATHVDNVQVGQYLEAGEPACSLVATGHVWVEANVKETDLTHVKIGDRATVTIDSYPHHEWTGRVVGISPATGAEFALIPPQNASGNWVKTVQRVPVEIELDANGTDLTLRAGLSAVVRIDTGHQRTLGDLARVFGTDPEG